MEWFVQHFLAHVGGYHDAACLAVPFYVLVASGAAGQEDDEAAPQLIHGHAEVSAAHAYGSCGSLDLHACGIVVCYGTAGIACCAQRYLDAELACVGLLGIIDKIVYDQLALFCYLHLGVICEGYLCLGSGSDHRVHAFDAGVDCAFDHTLVTLDLSRTSHLSD